MDTFTRAYIEAALWSSTDDDGKSMESYGISNISEKTLEEMIADCRDFQEANEIPQYNKEGYTDEEMAGHDFWLTRNHHGAGFWDRDLGEIGEKLTAAAHAYGEFNLYIGEDGKIYGE